MAGGNVSLSDVLKETENLRARSLEEPVDDKPKPAVVEPPPNMAMLSDLASFNEMKKK